MEVFEQALNWLSGLIWGPLMLILLVGTGIYLTVGLRFMTLRRIGYAFRMLWQGRKSDGEGDINPFQSLMTALAATIGTGNIAGVATAITLGGPGAIFWMWVTAVVGMATKFAEAVLAVRYREVDKLGRYQGGPMYYIRNGLGARWAWMAGTFASLGMVAAFGIGNTIQSNSVAQVVESNFGLSTWITGGLLAIFAGMVLIGGIRWIGSVAGKLVPVMTIGYIGGSLLIILLHVADIPAALSLIVSSAFNGTSAAGGFAGATVMMAIRFGVARGVFSNEAGLGTAPIAHATAKTNSPVRQGTIGMLGTFIDTIIVCTMTALVIILTGTWQAEETGATMTSLAYESALPGFGSFIVAFGLIIFAFTTILGWSFYGERCAEYIFGVKVIFPYRLLWILAIPIGAIFPLEELWLIADVMNGLMAVPNLIALLLLSPIVFRITRSYFAGKESDH